MCITVAPAKKEASLGIWHSESLGSPGENIPCGIALDNNAPVYGYCRLEQTKFGKSGFVLLDSENAIRDLLKHDRVKVLTGKANSKSSDWQTIEFKIRQQSLRNKAKPVYEYFK